MTQMTNSQARVVDPVLTSVARGYRNTSFIGLELFPVVFVTQRGGKIITFNKESWRQYNTARAPGAKTPRVSFGYTSSAYALGQEALEGVLPYEEMEEAQAVPGIDLGSNTVYSTMDIIDLRLEIAQATLATTAGNYGSSNKITLSGTSQWTDYANSNPLADVATGIEAIRQQTGVRPNTLVIGAAVWKVLKYHPKLLDAALLTSAMSVAGASAALTIEQAATVLDVKRLLVGDAVSMNASDVVSDVWGKFAVLAYTNIAPLASRGTPSYGYTYRLRNYPFVETPYYERNTKSWIYPVTDEVSPVIAGADAGYLISAAVA